MQNVLLFDNEMRVLIHGSRIKYSRILYSRPAVFFAALCRVMNANDDCKYFNQSMDYKENVAV